MVRPLSLAIVLWMAFGAIGYADRAAGGGAPVVEPWEVTADPSGPPLSIVDLDELVGIYGEEPPSYAAGVWSWQLLPAGLIYENYLAGTKESRLSAQFIKPQDESGWLLDGNLGGRVGILRYGTMDPIRPEGIQWDVEGAAQVRLDPEEHRDLRSADFRCGIPLSYGVGRGRWKFGYYHISAHLGDEFLLKNPGFPRLNFSRDVLLLGYAYYLTAESRLYGEAGWAFYSDVSEPWEFQFGIDHAPAAPTGVRGAPFWAVNGHLRQEVDFGGSVTAQAGWAWRSDTGSSLLRAGFHYFNGKSNQYSFYNEHEEQVGMGVWYDF